MSKNEYTPWKATGETELEYFKRLHLESEARLACLIDGAKNGGVKTLTCPVNGPVIQIGETEWCVDDEDYCAAIDEVRGEG